jgi:hypothetical protein
MITRCDYTVVDDGDRIYGLCFGLRANEFLGRNSYYKLFYGFSYCWR